MHTMSVSVADIPDDLRLERDIHIRLVRDRLSTIHHLCRSSQRPQILRARTKRIITKKIC